VKSRWRWLIVGVVLAAAILAAFVGSYRPAPGTNLTDLHNVDELRSQFNKDMGKVRIVLLLSPT
jgi:hypothetical protein